MPICRICGHECHCSNGGTCLGGQCDRSTCDHQ